MESRKAIFHLIIALLIISYVASIVTAGTVSSNPTSIQKNNTSLSSGKIVPSYLPPTPRRPPLQRPGGRRRSCRICWKRIGRRFFRRFCCSGAAKVANVNGTNN